MKNNKIEIILRRTEISDLDKLFQIQLDKDENDSAHKVKKLTDKTTYFTKCNKLLNDSTVNYQTITIDNIVVGSIAKFVRNREPEVTYIIDRKLWGQGIATKSLKIQINNMMNRSFNINNKNISSYIFHNLEHANISNIKCEKIENII